MKKRKAVKAPTVVHVDESPAEDNSPTVMNAIAINC